MQRLHVGPRGYIQPLAFGLIPERADALVAYVAVPTIRLGLSYVAYVAALYSLG
jgi:hypothetical protein